MIHKNTRLIIFITMSCIIPLFTNAQSWAQMENDYNSFLKNKQNDLAISKAREMHSWAMKSEGDTSIYLPISLKLIGNAFINANSDSAIVYFNLALTTLNKQKRENHIQSAKLHFNKSNIYNKLGDKNLSLFESEQANIILSILNYPEYPFCIRPLINAGILYREKQNYNSSIICFQKCSDLIEEYEGISSENYVASLYRLGNVYWESSNYDSALFIYKKAILIEKNLDGIEDSVKYKNILLTAQLFQSKNFNEDALMLYLKAEDFIKRINEVNETEYANLLGIIGNLYFDLLKYLEAEDYYKQTIDIYKKNLLTKTVHLRTISHKLK